MTKEIKVGRSRIALVDDEDYDLLMKFTWCPHIPTGRHLIYARTEFRVDGKRVSILMHRMILGLKRGEICDHASGDGLDNRRANLRKCTAGDNVHNSRKNKQSEKSPYKGVFVHGNSGKFFAHIAGRPGKTSRHIGIFDTAEAAARAYDAEAIRLHGEFARLNFPRYPDAAA